MIKDEEWLALCMSSESNEPHEWPYIGWVIRNRLESRPLVYNNYKDVILAPMQFSYFNQWTGKNINEDHLFELAMKGYAGKLQPIALSCAKDVMFSGAYQAPFGRKVRHYFSPVSMKPKGSAPAWASEADRQFTPSGVDPRRFVFCEGVP